MVAKYYRQLVTDAKAGVKDLRMADVFISYSRADREFVRKLSDSLAARARDACVDWQDIPLTAEWLEEVYTGIDQVHNFVFVITPESVKSMTCQKEIAHAVENHKRLIPLLHRAVPDMSVPEALAKLNFVFLRDSDDFEPAFRSLLEALDSDLDWKRAHTRLLVAPRSGSTRNTAKACSSVVTTYVRPSTGRPWPDFRYWFQETK
jgi:hypothetical protein